MAKIKQNKALALVKKYFEKTFPNITFQYTEGDDAKMSVRTNLAAVGLKVDASTMRGIFPNGAIADVAFTVSASGHYTLTAAFGKIEKSLEVLSLMNDYNCSGNWLTAFIEDDGRLTVNYDAMAYAEKDVADVALYIFDLLVLCVEKHDDLQKLILTAKAI